MNEPYFCWRVALTNKLELLKWAREEKKCEWDVGTINMAADQGNLEMVKYCVANECPINEFACANAAKNGHLECLKYLREEVKAPWDSELPLGRLQMVISTYSNILLSVSMINIAYWRVGLRPRDGHLDCLKYLHETAKWPWDSQAVREAHENNHTDCVQYLLDNDCPLPYGWRYENGELHDVTESESE